MPILQESAKPGNVSLSFYKKEDGIEEKPLGIHYMREGTCTTVSDNIN